MMSVGRLLAATLFVTGQASAASAELGGAAARGDNCTPYNSFKIGYGVPGGTIVSQRIVVVNGWKVAGWILDTASARHYYVPNPRFFDHTVNEGEAAAPPAFVALTSTGSSALNNAYRTARKTQSEYAGGRGSDAPLQLPAATLVARCYVHPLLTGRAGQQPQRRGNIIRAGIFR
jgi:hypothetical protein